VDYETGKFMEKIDTKLSRVLLLLKQNKKQEVAEMSVIDDLKANVVALTASVTAMKTVEQSAVATLKGLTDQQAILVQALKDAIAANDPVAIQEASDALAAQNQAVIDQTAELAAAIPANTPAT
jgi:hypothetical protein